jgi:hypothetical protein
MALREGTSALQWAATPPEDITPPVAVGQFVQVGLCPFEQGQEAILKGILCYC